MLFAESEEHGASKGLEIVKGKVVRFKNTLKIPHMGWNTVKLKIENEKLKMKMFENIPDNSFFYFVHSYYVVPEDKSVISATTDYGENFTSAIAKKNLWAVQFHPEKSAENGIKFLKNFLKKCSRKG